MPDPIPNLPDVVGYARAADDDVLDRFAVRFVGDLMALVCLSCDERVCDVEHGDVLLALVEVARDHPDSCVAN